MDGLEFVRAWLAPITAAFMAGWNVWLHWRGVKKAELEEIDTRIGALEHTVKTTSDEAQLSRADVRQRLAIVEHRLEEMPTKDAVHRLEMVVEGIRGDLRAMAEGMRAVERTTARVEDYLINSSEKR